MMTQKETHTMDIFVCHSADDAVTELVERLKRAGYAVQSGQAVMTIRERAIRALTLSRNLAALRQQMVNTVSLDDLRSLCFDLGIEFEDIAGDTNQTKTAELITALRRRERLPDLIELLSQQRSHIDWLALIENPNPTQHGPHLTDAFQSALHNSRRIILALTPKWLREEWPAVEAALKDSSQPSMLRYKLFPLILRPCELPRPLRLLPSVDITAVEEPDDRFANVLQALDQQRIFISYERHARFDQSLARQFSTLLRNAGHHVFDLTMPVGVEWAQEIRRQIGESDVFIVLLSDTSVLSEMVIDEVEIAHELQEKPARSGRPRILPLRISASGALPYGLSIYLDKFQYASWEGRKRITQALAKEILNSISYQADLRSRSFTHTAQPAQTAPPPDADPRPVASFRAPGGPVTREEFYIKRRGDRKLLPRLGQPEGSLTTIRAPRQSGKTSLLIRGVAQARDTGSRVAYIDFQAVPDRYLTDLDTFLRYFAERTVERLGMPSDIVERNWNTGTGPNDKLTTLLQDHILGHATDGQPTRILLAIDEADRLMRTNFCSDFFGLIRSWETLRAIEPAWKLLDIVMVISTEPSLLIDDFQSPFNVGLIILLEDFTEAQVRTLNERYGHPLADSSIPDLMNLLGGHPFLTDKALYTLATEEDMTWVDLVSASIREDGPFGDHLRRYLMLLSGRTLLADQRQLVASIKEVLDHNSCTDVNAFYRLSQAGLLKGNEKSCTFRCRLYEEYLRDRL